MASEADVRELRRLEQAYKIHKKFCDAEDRAKAKDAAIREELEHLVAAYHIAENFIKQDEDPCLEELNRLNKAYQIHQALIANESQEITDEHIACFADAAEVQAGLIEKIKARLGVLDQ